MHEEGNWKMNGWWKICFSPAMEKHPCHECLHSINIHRVRRSQQSGKMGGPRNYPSSRSLGSEGVELDDSKTGRAFPFENGWTEEVTRVVGSDENKEQSHREPGPDKKSTR